MKLAVIGDTLHHVDTEGRLCALAGVVAQLDQWAALFDEVELCAVLEPGPPPPGFAPYQSQNIRMTPVKRGGGSTVQAKVGLLPLAAHWWRVTREVARRNDAVHLRCPCNVTLVALYATRGVVRNRYAHYAGIWRGYAEEPWSYRWHRRVLERHFDGPVTVYSDAPAREHLVPFFSPSLSSAQWEGLADVVASKVRKVDAGMSPLRLATVGRLSANKNQAQVIEAVARLRREGRDVMLDVVGDGPMRDALVALAGELGVAERVTFHGPVEHERVLEIMSAAHMNVLATRQEGYGKVLLEGMAAGAVPVFGDSPLAGEISGNGRRGTVLPDVDAATIASAVAALADDSARWMAMVTAGREYTETATLEAFRERVADMLATHWPIWK